MNASSHRTAHPFHAAEIALVCLGSGKSAYFYLSKIHPTAALIMTEHPVTTNRVKIEEGSYVSYQQSSSVDDLADFLHENRSRPVIFIVTTTPERGRTWLEKLFTSVHKRLLDLVTTREVVFFLPQSPNPYVADFLKWGTVVVGDYFQGIGNAQHDPASNVSSGHFGTKGLIRYIIHANTVQARQQARKVVPTLTMHQPIIEHQSLLEIILLPSNTLLHMGGVISHLACALVEKGHADPAILTAPTIEDFFGRLHQVLKGCSREALLALLGGSLRGIGFYREMPTIGPDLLMDEMSKTVDSIRARFMACGLLPLSDLDQFHTDGRTGAHIFYHVRKKYAQQFHEGTGKAAHAVNFGTFIRENPPYQNPNIVFPTDASGRINTEHRFFHEEMPTMLMLLKLAHMVQLPDRDLLALHHVIQFNQFLCGKQYLNKDGSFGPDMPAYLQVYPLTTHEYKHARDLAAMLPADDDL